MSAFLTLVFCIHAAAFGYFFFTRGRRPHNLIFMLGFLFLVAYYGWDAVRGQSPVWLRYVGLGVVAVATVAFVIPHVKKARERIAALARRP